MTERSEEHPVLTRQRQAILDVIRDTPGHLTANEIFSAAKRRLPSISFATVYNSLRFLKAAGLIDELQSGGGASRFDRTTHRHDHAVCLECGSLVDIEMEHPAELLELASKYSGFKPESLSFTLRGLCPECNQ